MREEKQLTQFGLAVKAKQYLRRTKLHPSSISAWERGAPPPPVSVFLALAKALGVPPRELTAPRRGVA